MITPSSKAYTQIPNSLTVMPPIAMPHQKKPNTIIIYPTIAPETVVIPIVSCIFGFPLLALLIICCLRHRAKLARERDRRRTTNFTNEHSAMSLVRLSPMHKLGVYLAGAQQQKTKNTSTRNDRAMSRNFQSLELDTVIEERSSEPDIENTLSSMEAFSQSSHS
ncbi:uncharacterized protein LOC135831353 [Planococcus citri]|uniref:uncharacterized protein LOC135831353 n=1 Tax=Planococcus citri TaxID=170843 RepID=UPI0031F8BA42